MANSMTAKEMKTRDLRKTIQAMTPEIKKALPAVMTAERFTRLATTAVSTNPKLADCSPASFLGALMQAAQLGLEPNTPLGQAYLIPYGNQCQFQLGYKGLIELAHRSGEFKNISAHEVYENDVFEYAYGLEPMLVHKPALSDRGEVKCYYAAYTLVNGGVGFEVMSKEDVVKHMNRFTKTKSSQTPWKTDFDEMAKKTVMKKVLKYAPIKTDFARGISSDETVKDKIMEDMSLVPDVTPIEAEAEVVDVSDELIDDAADQEETEAEEIEI